MAAANSFYRWQVEAGNLRVNPIPQRPTRSRPVEAGRIAAQASQTPATYSHGAGRKCITWLPASSYRRWRDVGMRGYTTAGLPDPRFRGRWASRNAAFCDLMVRTGLRLSEQAALTVFEVPLDRGYGGYRRFWLPPAAAKGGSARWIYVPMSVIADLIAYFEIDRATVIAEARAAGRYARMRRPLVVPDPMRPVAVRHHVGGRQRIKIANLDDEDRQQLLIDGPDGLEPAAFWLSEYGLPVAVPTWKHLFATANTRCQRKSLSLRAHPHMLRHTYAVLTLEQLQRGHIDVLGEQTSVQRAQYTRVFGDPLDWVRRRLGHQSVTTTQIYLDSLAELEMETRMALVPDDWEDPRDISFDDLVEDRPASGAG
ncbi:hypothetical protein [Micromonospora sp. URMC 103]|uniref:hypothetical protein n=1 Tax=Micromonospora sp. URMC 103 TaxID=3423406 RepID=UPI003F1AAF5A